MSRLLRRVSPRAIASLPVAQYPDVASIIDGVRAGGDQALEEFARRFGDPEPRAVSPAELVNAYDRIDLELRAALEGMARRVGAFADVQRAALTDVSCEIDGTQCGHRSLPIASAAIYVPGGRYPLPSSLIMGCVPARIAGVERVVVASPSVAPEVLAAAHICGITEYYLIGGAQAIAALAYGTRAIAPVDFIAGPGNAYVTAAKRAVYGSCGIDALAGPSEVVVVASGDADADLIAADLLAQAEHDPGARCVLFTDSSALADEVDAALERRLPVLRTAAVARASLRDYGFAAVCPLPEAVRESDRIAPEHLQLHGEAASALAHQFSRYGALFIGAQSAEVFGDYGAGPNHILPTGGTARFSSGLSVLSFLQLRTYQQSAQARTPAIAQAATVAACEGLDAHAAAAVARSTDPALQSRAFCRRSDSPATPTPSSGGRGRDS